MRVFTFAVICSFSMLLAGTSSFAGKTPSINFTKQAELPEIGVSFKMLSGAKAMPLSPPTVYTYTFSDNNGASWKEEKYVPHTLWYSTQHAGSWIDSYTNMLTLAKIDRPCLHNISSKHVSRERFKMLSEAVQTEPVNWTDEELRGWVADFMQGNKVTSSRLKVNSFKIKDVIKFQVDLNPRLLAYAFKLNKSAAGQKNAPDTYFFFSIHLNRDADHKRAEKTLHSSFITSLKASTSKATGTRTASTKFQVKKSSSFTFNRNAPERSAEFIESRTRVANSIRNLKDWWFVNTENYIILSNLSLSHKIMVKELQEDIEYLRGAYARLIPAKKPITAVSVLRVFGSPSSYEAYVGPEYKWTGGLWMSSKKEMVIKPIDWGKNKDQRARVKKVTYHEAFHQYIHYALDQSRISVWFNEGHAELFAHSEIKNSRLELLENEYQAERLTRMIASNTADTQALIKMDYPDFYCDDDEKRSENYTLAWGIVYYLRKGAEFDRPASNKAILDRYVESLWTTRDPQKATTAAFAAINPAKFQQDFLAFWKSKTKRSQARRNKLFDKK